MSRMYAFFGGAVIASNGYNSVHLIINLASPPNCEITC